MYQSKSVIIRNGKTLIIRPAISDDAKAILDYINQIAGESDNLTFGPGEFDKTIDDERKFISKINITQNNIFVVALIDNEIVALADIHCGNRPRTKHTGNLGISVKKKYWRLGIGEALMKYLIKWAYNSNIVKKINLEVREDNTAAINLYKKMGFIEEGRISRVLYIKGKFYSTISMGLEIGE
ncbi:N-acetyltransferase family protein [Candidatus Harpocratesius sp.]